MKKVRLGHSPDADDAFMHYAIIEEKIDCNGFSFIQTLADIQSLNEMAIKGQLDITAISVHAYPYVAQHYIILPCGASMGDGYGPVVVAKRPLTKNQLKNSIIAVPGLLTSAMLALELWLDMHYEQLNYVVMPFDMIQLAVKKGEVDVGLLIHEGQLTFEKDGLYLIQDLGQWWKCSHHGLPLPLGINVIKKTFSAQEQRLLSQILKNSIEYGLNHMDEAIEYAIKFSRGLEHRLVKEFIGRYVNKWTIDCGPIGHKAIITFLTEGVQRGFVPEVQEIKFVE